MAHKKAAWSAKNLRTSRAKYRGVKLFGGEVTHAGNIVIRQKGDVYQLGKNVYKGKDFTIHSAIDGVVHFRKKNITRFDGSVYLKTFVDVLPADEDTAAKAPKVATAKVAKPAAKKEAAPKVAKATKEDAAEADDNVEAKAAPVKKVAAKTTAKPAAKAEKKPAAKPAKKKEA